MSRSQKSNQVFSLFQQCTYVSFVKIPSLLQTLFWTFQSASVTLKIRSRSQKINQLFPFSQQCIYATLVKIEQPVQKIVCGNGRFNCFYRVVTLKIMSRSPKSNQLFSPFQQCTYVSFCKNPFTASNPILDISECQLLLLYQGSSLRRLNSQSLGEARHASI